METELNTVLEPYQDRHVGNTGLHESEWSTDHYAELGGSITWVMPLNEGCLHGIDHIYADLHRRLDQVAAQAIFFSPTQANQIRQQNREVVEKLAALESVLFDSGSGSPLQLPSSTASLSTTDGRAGAGRKGRASQSRKSRAVSTVSRRSQLAGPDCGDVFPSSPRLIDPTTSIIGIDSALAAKLLRIGNDETKVQVVEFSAHVSARRLRSSASTAAGPIPSAADLTDMSSLMRLVVYLGATIESSAFGEQHFRAKRRMALAQFYHAYTIAQNHSELFLSWCDEHHVRRGSLPPKGSRKTAVQHRFADLVFDRASQHSAASVAGPSTAVVDDTKKRCAKIQTWRKTGKSWAKFVERFGYGILLLVPLCLSDEE